MRTRATSRARGLGAAARPAEAAEAAAMGAVPVDALVAASVEGDVACRARVVRLVAGLWVIVVGPVGAESSAVAGFGLPATLVAAGPAGDGAVEIVAGPGAAPGWLGAAGGTVVARVPAGGGSIVVTSFGLADAAALPRLQILDLARLSAAGEAGAPLAAARAPAAPEPAAAAREVPSEFILHIERQGDRQLPARGWVGNPGQHLRIEGFAIRPLAGLAPGDVEYMGFGPRGRQTPWVTDARLCGTRGRGLPLTGFAVRLAPALRERYEVVYEGHFFASGPRGPMRDGDPCLPAIEDDPLSAIRLHIAERPIA